MRTGFFGLMAGAMALVATFVSLAEARPLTPAEQRYNPWRAQLPRCDDPSVLSFVQSRFGQRESYYWKSGLEIDRIERARETGFRKTGLDYIPRRYCEARAVVNDARTRVVVYSVGEDMDMTGGDVFRSFGQSLTLGLLPDFNPSPLNNWGVDWCVVGLDRHYAHGLNCKAARP